jgi:hypothetical protein
MAAIIERETRIRAIADKLIEPGPGSLQKKLDGLRTLAVSRLTRLRELLANDPSHLLSDFQFSSLEFRLAWPPASRVGRAPASQR